MKTGTIAVITGDLINSSQFETEQLAEIMTKLNKEFKILNLRTGNGEVGFSISRGDSFQGIVEDPMEALSIALGIKAFLNSYNYKNDEATNTSPIVDVRLSIGIGEANYDLDSINISNGEAFQLSGRILDMMKAGDIKMTITTPIQDLNDEFYVHMKFLDSTTDRWSMASAEVVYYFLKGLKEREIAEKLNRSQAAINHRKKAAGWFEIRLLLKRYKQVIKSNFT